MRSFFSPVAGQYDSRLDDWRDTGYKKGKPFVEPEIKARPNTLPDLRDALKNISGGILMPEGTMTLTERITVRDYQYLCWRPTSALFFPKSLHELFGIGEAGGGDFGWSHADAFLETAWGSIDCGFLDARVLFPKDFPYPGHHKERGFNAFALHGKDNYLRSRLIENADNGVFIERGAEDCTAKLGVVRSFRVPDSLGRKMHHPAEFQRAVNSMIENFDIQCAVCHPVSFERAEYCAYRNGKLVKGKVDFHRSKDKHSHYNLVSNVTGFLPQAFDDAGPQGDGELHAGEGNLLWNCTQADGKPITEDPTTRSDWGSPKLYIIPHALSKMTPDKQWYEPITNLEPKDLVAEQRGEISQPQPPSEPQPEPEPMPPANKFMIGDTVRCNVQSNIRSSAGIKPDNKIGTQPIGATGTVQDGPVVAGAYIWWRINFDSGVDGWVGEGTLNQ